MITWDPSNHWFHVPASERMRRSPWAYNRGASSFLVPGFAIEEYGYSLRDAVATHKPNALKWEPLDLVTLPVSLWDFQAEDVLRLLRGAWGEWAQVGLGKTVMALSAYRILREQGHVDGMIVVGPESASHAWAGKSSDTSEYFNETGFRVKAGAKKWPSEGVIFVNYDKIYRPNYSGELLKRIRTGRWIMCLDEAHMVSNGASKRFQTIDLWSRFVRWRWLLTGTPVSNYPDKLWALWKLLTNNDCTAEQWSTWFKHASGEWHKARLGMLGRYLSTISRVRTRKQVAPSLPPTTIRVIRVRMEGPQRSAYDGMIRKQEAVMGDHKVRGWDWMGVMVHLLSLCSHPELPFKPERLTESCAKLEALEEILEGLGETKCCVWSWHPEVLKWLARVLPYKSVQYHGDIGPRAREQAIHEFNNGDAQLFLGNPSAAGAGLNLPAGDVRIYWDASWSPVEYDQSAGRIERGLSYSPKTEYRLVAENSIEEYTWECLARKENLKTAILGGQATAIGDTWSKGIAQRWLLGG